MGENTHIEWAHHTFNPWEGCTKVGPGCDHCYAEARNHRFGGDNWGPGAPRRRTSAANWQKPLKWNREAEAKGIRYRVFCASLADVFDNEVPWQWRLDLFGLIRDTPHLDWLLLTKRIGNVPAMLDEIQVHGALGDVFPNVWLGATIVNQQEADRDIPKLLCIPAAVRFLSMEPLLGAVDLTKLPSASGIGRYLDALTNAGVDPGALIPSMIDWVIIGGESGPNARPMHPDWARDIRDQCNAAGVPFLFKQWGEWVPRGPLAMGYPSIENVPRIRLTDLGENGSDLSAEGDSHCWMQRAGKKRAGRLLDGQIHDGFPIVENGEQSQGAA